MNKASHLYIAKMFDSNNKFRAYYLGYTTNQSRIILEDMSNKVMNFRYELYAEYDCSELFDNNNDFNKYFKENFLTSDIRFDVIRDKQELPYYRQKTFDVKCIGIVLKMIDEMFNRFNIKTKVNVSPVANVDQPLPLMQDEIYNKQRNSLCDNLSYDEFLSSVGLNKNNVTVWGYNDSFPQNIEYIYAELKKNPFYIANVIKQTEIMCILAVNTDGRSLLYVQDELKKPEICYAAIANNPTALLATNMDISYIKYALEFDGMMIRYVPVKTDEINLLAVSQNGEALQYISNPSYSVCKVALSQNGLALRFVKNQTIELCIIAVKQNPEAMKYVNLDLFKA